MRVALAAIGLAMLVGFSAWRISALALGRARAEDDAREGAQKFRALLFAAPDPVVIADTNDRIVLFSEQAERVFGWAAAEVVGRAVEVLVPEQHGGIHERHEPHTLRLDRGAISRPLDIVARRRDGTEFPVSINRSQVCTQEGIFVFNSIRDLTAPHRAERAILELNASLESRNQELARVNEALSQKAAQLEAANHELEAFSYSAAHDLRSPLRSIDGFSRVLLDRYGPTLDPTAQNYLARVRAGAQRMGVLLDDLLRLSRMTRAEMHEAAIDLAAESRRIAADLHAEEPHRRVSWTIAPELPAHGDPHLVRAALENLLGNAWKYTSGRAVAHIEVGIEPGERETAFFVRDDGAGFDPSYVDRLFRPFQRLHTLSEFPGTGVGLALVRRIVHRHGGRVWADGEPGRGATFRFTLAPPGATESHEARPDDELEPARESA